MRLRHAYRLHQRKTAGRSRRRVRESAAGDSDLVREAHAAARHALLARSQRDAIGPLYEAMGTRVFDTPRDVDPLSASGQGSRSMLEPLLLDVGLPTGGAGAAAG